MQLVWQPSSYVLIS